VFRDVRLDSHSGSEIDERQRRTSEKKKKGIKSEQGEGQKKGFFASLFGCCTSAKH